MAPKLEPSRRRARPLRSADLDAGRRPARARRNARRGATEPGSRTPSPTTSRPSRPRTAALCERAGAEVRQLNHEPGALIALEGLGRQLLRSEALASSQIEGLSISHRKLAEAEFGDLANYKAREIVGTMKAMERALAIGIGPEPLSVEAIEAIHREIAVVPPLDKIAGQIREEPSWIGGVDPSSAEYVGPPADQVRGLLEDLCRFMARDDISPVAQAAIAHAQFETIHPFGDGNGRVGRCLIQVLFRRRGLAPTLPAADQHRARLEQGRLHQRASKSFRAGEVDGWAGLLRGARPSSRRSRSREFSEEVEELQSDWRARCNRSAPIRPCWR